MWKVATAVFFTSRYQGSTLYYLTIWNWQTGKKCRAVRKKSKLKKFRFWNFWNGTRILYICTHIRAQNYLHARVSIYYFLPFAARKRLQSYSFKQEHIYILYKLFAFRSQQRFEAGNVYKNLEIWKIYQRMIRIILKLQLLFFQA